MRDDGLIGSLLISAGSVIVKIIEQPPGLILLWLLRRVRRVSATALKHPRERCHGRRS
jgi:hypothetical protein